MKLLRFITPVILMVLIGFQYSCQVAYSEEEEAGVVRCTKSEYPACGGECPEGEECKPDTKLRFCYCVKVIPPEEE